MKKTIFLDYPDPIEFRKRMEPAYKNPTTAYSDKRVLSNKLIAEKISETAWKELGGDRYLGERIVFYNKLESRLTNIYIKTIRKENIINQVYKSIKDFLTVNITEKKSRSEKTDQSISDTQQPILSLGDMTGGSYGAYKNRADWLRADKRIQTQIVEGMLDYNDYETDDKGQIKIGPDGKPKKKLDSEGKPVRLETPVLKGNQSQKVFDERTGVGAILNALQFLEVDLEEEFQSIRRDLMNPFDISEGKFYTDYATGRIKFKSWDEIEDEIEGDDGESRRQIKSFRYDHTKSYVENLKDKIVMLKEELKITGNRDLVQLRIKACESLVEAWETPQTFPTLEEFRKEMNKIIGYEEFKKELEAFLIVSELYQKQGKVIPQQFFLLLGPPGIGKSLISRLAATALGRQFININCVAENKGHIVGIAQDYTGKDFGKITKKMIEGKDRAPFVLFDEIDKCGDEEVLNPISILFDKTKNKQDFEDIYFQFPIPMNECFFIATANYERGLPGFVKDRCTRVKLKPFDYKQRITFTQQQIEKNLNEVTPQVYEAIKSKLTENFLKKFLTESYSVRGIDKNVTTFL